MAERKALPYIALVSGILALSLSSLFVRWANAPGIVTAFYRMTLASALFLPFFLRHTRRNPQARTAFFRWIPLVLLGGVFTSLDHAIWSAAIQTTKVANATFFNNVAPLWVALWAWLVFRERRRGRFWVGLLFTLGGAGIIFGYDLIFNPHLSLGDLLGIISSLFYAAYFLNTQQTRRKLDTLTYTWGVTTTAAVVLFLSNLFFNFPLTGYSSATYLSFIGAALISQTVGYFSIGYALGHLPASVVSPTMIAQPLLTALLAIPLAGEPLHASVVLGGLLVLGGIYLVNS